MSDREDFETWLNGLEVGYSTERYTEYHDAVVQGLWTCWQASRMNFSTIAMKPIIEAIVQTGVKQVVMYAELLAAAERYLDFRHTSDIGMGEDYSGVHPQTELKNAIAKAKGAQI